MGTAIRKKTWFSVTARMTKTVTTAITSIAEDDWVATKYPNAIWEEAEQRWVSDAEVAEVPFVAFTGRRQAEHVTCRLLVRRVKSRPVGRACVARSSAFAGRIASTSRRLDLHLPIHWPWAEGWQTLHAVATGPPPTATN